MLLTTTTLPFHYFTETHCIHSFLKLKSYQSSHYEPHRICDTLEVHYCLHSCHQWLSEDLCGTTSPSATEQASSFPQISLFTFTSNPMVRPLKKFLRARPEWILNYAQLFYYKRDFQVPNFTPITLMLISLRIQPCIFDKLEKAMAILAFFFC